MKKLVSLTLALIFAAGLTTLYAKVSDLKACSKDNKTVVLTVDFDEAKDHDVATHYQAAFSKMAAQFTGEGASSHDAFIAFITALDEVDQEAFNQFPNGAPRVVEGESCH